MSESEEEQDLDQRICACGHPVYKHEVIRGVQSCKRRFMEKCPCMLPRPVLRVSDPALFVQYASRGNDYRHALSFGIRRLFYLSKQIEKSKGRQPSGYLVEGHFIDVLVGCGKCGCEMKLRDIVPVMMAIPTKIPDEPEQFWKSAWISETPTGVDMLICMKCYGEYCSAYDKIDWSWMDRAVE